MKIVSCHGLMRYAEALKYVLRRLLGMPDVYLLCPVFQKGVRFLANEILMSGNFGHKEPRMGAIASESGHLKKRVNQAGDG